MINEKQQNNRHDTTKKILKNDSPALYDIGCAGKITSFNETNDGRYLIVLNGISRFKIVEELKNDKLYRECSVILIIFSR